LKHSLLKLKDFIVKLSIGNETKFLNKLDKQIIFIIFSKSKWNLFQKLNHKSKLLLLELLAYSPWEQTSNLVVIWKIEESLNDIKNMSYTFRLNLSYVMENFS